MTLLHSRQLDDSVTVIVLVTLLLALGLVGLLWTNWTRAALAPTPTPTPHPSPTSTPDVRATQIQREILTRVATQGLSAPQQPSFPDSIPDEEIAINPFRTPGIVLLPLVPGGDPPTPTPVVTAVDNPVEIATDTPTPEPSATPTATSTPTVAAVTGAESVAILLPVVPVAASPSPTPTPPFTPTPTETPTATPTPTETPFIGPPPSATPTNPPPTPIPTETPSLTPSPTSYVVNELSALVRAANDAPAEMRRGPSVNYEKIADITTNQQVALRGRDVSGEWVFLCCIADQVGWLRQAQARPEGNTLPADAPDDAAPNDVRWLPIEPPPAGLPLPPVAPSIPAGMYPFYRHDQANQGHPAELPVPPLESVWPLRERAQGEMLSPVVMSDRGVLVTNADGHLYSFHKASGDQRWRFNLENQPAALAPAVGDPFIYVLDQAGVLYALEDRDAGVDVRWRRSLEAEATTLTPVTGINLFAETLYMGGQNSSGTPFLLAIDRNDGDVRFAQRMGTDQIMHPAIGGQLVYVGGQGVWAMDALNGATVWQQENLPAVSAPPVYVSPGPSALAELYVVTRNSLFVLDANTGDEVWNLDTGEAITGLAVDSRAVYLSGASYVKAISRNDRNQMWRADINGEIVSGPLVGPEHVLAVTRTGTVQFLQAADGLPIYTFVVGTTVVNSVAASGPYLFMPSMGRTLRAYRGMVSP